MDEKSPNIDSLLAAYELALAEEHMLWRSINDVKLKPTDRLMAYARWRAAAERVKVLASRLHGAE